MPRISIILPTHNGERFIARAIKSVQAQTFTDWELLIIDDGSDVPPAAVDDVRVKSIRFEKNQGIQHALAEGLNRAQGEYIARIDDDDEWCDNNKLQSQLDYFTAHSDCVLVGTGLIVVNEQGRELYRFLNPQTDAKIRSEILYRNCFSHSTVMFKKSSAMQFGGYGESEAVRHVEDYDLWLKLGTIGSFANLPEYSVRLTARSTSISGQHKLLQFKNQLAITGLYKSNASYKSYSTNRLKSYLRYLLYFTFGSLVPLKLQNSFIKRYKN